MTDLSNNSMLIAIERLLQYFSVECFYLLRYTLFYLSEKLITRSLSKFTYIVLNLAAVGMHDLAHNCP